MLDDNIDDCRSFRPEEVSVSLSDSEDLREFLSGHGLSDAVQLVEALGQLDDVAEEENYLAYNQMMRDVL